MPDNTITHAERITFGLFFVIGALVAFLKRIQSGEEITSISKLISHILVNGFVGAGLGGIIDYFWTDASIAVVAGVVSATLVLFSVDEIKDIIKNKLSK